MNVTLTPAEHEIAASLVRLGFLRLPSAVGALHHGAHVHRDGIAIRARLPRRATNLDTLVFEMDPNRGYRGRINSFAELRVKTTKPNWENEVAFWIGQQLPLAKAKVDADEERREHYADIKRRVYAAQESLREQVRTIYRNDKFVNVLSDDTGIAGARMEIRVDGRNVEEIMAKLRQVLDLPGVH